MADEILARVAVSTPRRWIGMGMLGALGGLLVWIALAQPPADLGLRLFVLVFGGLVLWAADQMRRRSAAGLELTHEALRDSSGRVLVRLDQIEKVDRGALAFKPSNGFVLKLRSPHPRQWVPGVWWCTGRRLGVGGVTVGPQTRMMAEILQSRISARR